MESSDHRERAEVPRVVHVTTAHRADDVRVFERECRSLADSRRYDVYLAAAGSIPAGSGVTLIPLPPKPSSRAERFISGPRKALALPQVLAADLWHFHDPELLPVALTLATRGRRVIWDAHEDYLAQFHESGAKHWVPRPLRGVVRRGTGAMLAAIDRYASGVVAATPTIASRYTNSRTVIVGNEARLEHFSPCRPDYDSRQILFTGKPGPWELFDEVVNAVALVPGARLVVAGEDPDPAIWGRARATLGHRIAHLGWLDRAGLAKAISASSLGLVTYADIPAYSVSSPTKSFEFAAAGLPVVATPNRMNIKTLGVSGAGVVAEDFSSPALQAAIARALSDRGAWRAASEAGRQWAAREGSWSQSEVRLLRLYADILETSED